MLMVTGAYYPEMSGAGLQCRALIGACGDRVRFSVLTTAVDSSLPADDHVDGVPVHRVRVSATSRLGRALAAPRLLARALRTAARADIVHLHGFSAKSRVVMAIARLLGKPVIIKLTSVGHDDGVAMRRQGGGAFHSYARADRFVAVSPRFTALHSEAGLPPAALSVIANGVDLERFHPPSPADKAGARRDLGLAEDALIVLFVGFFSREKRPDVVFEAWTSTFGAVDSALVLIGLTQSPYYEIDPALAGGIRRDAERLHCSHRVMMVERSDAIERYYQAADVLMLPSTREGLPNVVLEAMASGLPCIVSRLPGVTDTLIADGDSGLLIEPGDRAGFAGALTRLLTDAALRARLGAGARAEIEARYSMAATAARYVALYRELLGDAAA